jgi:hypothetical protein
MTAACLDDGGQSLFATSVYDEMVPSDKASISYWLGMGLAQLMAEREMAVDCLLHVDPLIKLGHVSLTPTPAGRRVKGDLVGQDQSGDWHVFEAKGRYGSPGGAGSTAKSQARSITSAFGTPPATNCASVSVVDTTRVKVELHDPPADRSAPPTHIDGNVGSCSAAHYELLSRYLDEAGYGRESVLGSTFETAAVFPCTADVRVGIAEDIRIALRKGVRQNPDLVHWRRSTESAEDWTVGPDGIALFVKDRDLRGALARAVAP